MPTAKLHILVVLIAVLIGLGVVIHVGGCGGSSTRPIAPAPTNPFMAYAIGSDTSFEAVTWNLHNFATDDGSNEVTLAVQAIAAMGADVVAIQEIAESHRFDEILAQLPAWSGYQARSDRYQNLGYVWLDSTVTLNAIVELDPPIDDAWLAFPRLPLVLEISWMGHELVLINNHLKCCGDGALETEDDHDEETRRLYACQLLEDHIATAYTDRAVILLGDLNDDLTDLPQNNVFAPFLDQPDRYRFVDMALAEGSSLNWSWGPGSGHLDHILISTPLFAAFDDAAGICRTLRIDQALPAGEYRQSLSDHAPVMISLPQSRLP